MCVFIRYILFGNKWERKLNYLLTEDINVILLGEKFSSLYKQLIYDKGT